MTILKKYLAYVSFENILCVLLFMYPLFATVVRHWNSTLFGLLILLGLTYYFSKGRNEWHTLHRYEKLFLLFLAGNFLVFGVTSLLNSPERFSGTRFDIELRFLLIIPLYFLLQRCEGGFKWFAYGAAVSIFIALGYCINVIVIKGRHDFSGIYSHLYTGPILLVYAIISIFYFLSIINKNKKVILVVVFAILLAAGYEILHTYSRVTYVSVFVMTVMAAGLFVRRRLKIVSMAVIVAGALITGIMSDNVSSRLSMAYNNFIEYMDIVDTEKRIGAEINTSVGTRLEMWRAAPLVLRDHTLFGVGNGNYNKAMQTYVENKELNKVVNQHGHAHNVFVNVLIVKGLLGLIITTLVLFYPLYVYIKTYKDSEKSASLGILYVTVIFLISMNETAPFVKSNFVATYLLISLIVFQYHMRAIKSKIDG